MESTTRLQRLGDVRTGWWIIGTILLLSSLSFALYYPDAIAVRDEGSYIRQTRLLLQGTTALHKTNPFTGRSFEAETLLYPVGTALVTSPFVWLGGWRGAFVAPFCCFLLSVLITARWLTEAGRAPVFALLLVGFPATLVLSRIAMSDAPSLLVVTLGMWLYWRGLAREQGTGRCTGRAPNWLGAGLLAGASLLWRESNVLVFVPFFAGSLVRRDSQLWCLVVGGVAGVGLRLLSGQLAYDDPFFYKSLDYGFSLSNLPGNLALQALALLVFIPGGLIAVLAYRGQRRPEVQFAVFGIVAFYLSYGYSGGASGGLKGLVLGQRYMLPLLPLLAFCMAESAPRLGRRYLASASQQVAEHRRNAISALCLVWIAGVAAAAIAVHPAMAAWGDGQAEIRREIKRWTGRDPIIVTNWDATSKHFDLLEGRYFPIDRDVLQRDALRLLIQLHQEIFVVFLDRNDSEYWRQHSRRNESEVRLLPGKPELLVDRWVTESERLRIWRIRSSRPREAEDGAKEDS